MERRTRLVLALGVAASAACAGLSHEAAQRPLEAALDAMPIERPIDDIWTEVRRMLTERGYSLAGKDAEAVGQGDVGLWQVFSRAKETEATGMGGRRLETGWGPRRNRYVAEAVGAGGAWRIRLTLVSEDLTEHGRDGAKRRDAAAELELVRRVDPGRAAAILERAEGGEPRQGLHDVPKP